MLSKSLHLQFNNIMKCQNSKKMFYNWLVRPPPPCTLQGVRVRQLRNCSLSQTGSLVLIVDNEWALITVFMLENGLSDMDFTAWKKRSFLAPLTIRLLCVPTVAVYQGSYYIITYRVLVKSSNKSIYL